MDGSKQNAVVVTPVRVPIDGIVLQEAGGLAVARLAREWFGRHVAAPHLALHGGW